MIERRHKGFVIDKGLVPVANVCESIGTGKSMDDILKMYPVSYTHLTLPTNREV